MLDERSRIPRHLRDALLVERFQVDEFVRMNVNSVRVPAKDARMKQVTAGIPVDRNDWRLTQELVLGLMKESETFT